VADHNVMESIINVMRNADTLKRDVVSVRWRIKNLRLILHDSDREIRQEEDS
jgi:hypothetical protein